MASIKDHPLARAFLSLALVLVLGAVFNADGTFLQWATQRDMLRQVSVYGILACGMSVVIIAGGIDLRWEVFWGSALSHSLSFPCAAERPT